MAKKSERARLVEWLDKELIATGGELTVKDTIAYCASNKVALEKKLVCLLFYQRCAKYEGKSPKQFLLEYLKVKFEQYEQGDKGARGDAIEALTRFYLKHGFVHYNDVMTQSVKKSDVSAKRAVYEIGHNGKTFQEALIPEGMEKADLTAENYMNGRYNVLIYGVFNPNFTIKSLLNEEKFLTTMKVFPNKYEFCNAIAGRNGISSGWNVSHCRATVQYNYSLQNRFTTYCEEHNIMTLKEYLETLHK
jgi:hypothetical protein